MTSSFTLANSSGITAAVKSDMTTATSSKTYVNPGVQQYAIGMAKAWAYASSLGSSTLIASYNITSVSGSGGAITFTYTTNFTTNTYCAVGGANTAVASFNFVQALPQDTKSTSQIKLTVNGGNTNYIGLACYGSQ